MTADRDLLRQKALAAAASVVLALGAAGCSPSLLVKDDTSARADTSGDSAAADPAPDCTALAAEALGACCEARSTWCADTYGAATEDANTCTYGPDYDGSTGCIPWGPPSPPRFRGAVA